MHEAAALNAVSRELAEVGRRFYQRGWVMGTSGNLSVVVGRDPLRVAMTPSGAHKGHLRPEQILTIDDAANVVGGPGGRPSAEALLHLELIRAKGAGAVLHTHSVWSTVLSDRHAAEGAMDIHGYEMLKGLDGVTSHDHRERIPILANDQDMTRLSGEVRRVLGETDGAHAFILRRHGLYTWGRTLADAERHIEILEFLFEAIGRSSHGPGAHS